MSNEQQETIKGGLWDGEPLLVGDALQGANGLFVVTGRDNGDYIFGDSKVGQQHTSLTNGDLPG